MNYNKFLESKHIVVEPSGFSIPKEQINCSLFPFQRDIVLWGLRKGRAALFEGTGLGKTFQSLEWSKHVNQQTKGDILILAPLAVSHQTIREGRKFGIEVHHCRSQADVKSGINITNYERLHLFDCSSFAGVVLDESSCLKSYSAQTRKMIIDSFSNTPFKLACTATPAPNDYMELGNHAEFLGIMSYTEMLSMFFVHDGGRTSQWRLKGHAQKEFWNWIASWAVMLEKPSDLGYDDNGFILPPLNIQQITIRIDKPPEGFLFVVEARTLDEQRKAKRSSLKDRVDACAEIANSLDEPCIIWCYLNDESETLTKTIRGAAEVRGSHSPEYKEQALLDFSEGRIQKLISKPQIAGFGMNWQHCSKVIFCGLDHSFESWFQAIRRCWRFGQTNPVDVYVVVSDAEGAIAENIKRKEREFREMLQGIISATQEITKVNIRGTSREVSEYATDIARGNGWEIHLGDCVEVIKNIPDDSIHYTIFSPPFASLYTYSNSNRDMGNCRNEEEFMQHFCYLINELYRVLMPGRLLSFHCMDIPAMKERDGYIGLKDFPGDLIRLFQSAGFIYHSKVVVWKDPLIEATRTKALGLMHKQIVKDSAMCRQGLPDYLVTVRKPGVNTEPISHPEGLIEYVGIDEPNAPKKEPTLKNSNKHTNISMHRQDPVYSHHVWRRYASPVWMDINPSGTLQKESVREHADEKHICHAAGTLILTRRGYIPIENTETGEEVLTHLGRWRPITAKACIGNRPVVQVKAQGVPNLIITPEHKLYTRMKKDYFNGKCGTMRNLCPPEWIEAKNSKGLYVNLKLPPTEISELTAQDWWIIGRFIADGSVGERNNAAFVVAIGDKKLDEFFRLSGDYAGNFKHNPKCNCTQVRLKSLPKKLKDMLYKVGHGAGNKHVPYEGLCLNYELSKALLDGYLSGDGHTDSIGRKMASSISRALLLEIAIVIQRAENCVASVYAGRPARESIIQGRKVQCKQEWVMMYTPKEAVTYRTTSGTILDDGAWKKIRSITDKGIDEVWAIEVAEDHSYHAEGCIVQNCPLQLQVIERALQLWTNPGDVVLDPFDGIGSTGYVAIKAGRRHIGIELKRSYWEQAVKNLQRAEMKIRQPTLFEELEVVDG